jgi:hypothetical protein
MDNNIENLKTTLLEDSRAIRNANEEILELTQRGNQADANLQTLINEQRDIVLQAENRIAVTRASLAAMAVNTELETRLNNIIMFIYTSEVNPLQCTLPDRRVEITRIGDISNLNGNEVRACLRQHGQSDRCSAAEVRQRLAVFAGFPEPVAVRTFF